MTSRSYFSHLCFTVCFSCAHVCVCVCATVLCASCACTGGGFDCELRATVLAPAGSNSVRITVAPEWGEEISKVYPLGVSSGMARHSITISLDVAEGAVELWWPRRMGSQRLYAINVSVSPAVDPRSLLSPASTSASYSSTISKTVGFRTVELVTSHGFSLKVNGHDVFAFGANVIPLSSFEPTFTDDMINGLLDAAVDQHINLLRVWGGGDYMRESFAKRCDELGIMVWNDMSFNNAVYPSGPEDLAGYKAEAAHQVARLGHHPSIVLWCGNNEIEDDVSMLSTPEYQKINYATLIPALAQADPTRPIWPSSPSNGYKNILLPCKICKILSLFSIFFLPAD